VLAAQVEPSVNILQILDYLLPRGYTLPVVPELDELTVGGLVNGYGMSAPPPYIAYSLQITANQVLISLFTATPSGIETSSHVFGLFNDICVSFELVLPDGTVQRVTRDDKLFYAVSECC